MPKVFATAADHLAADPASWVTHSLDLYPPRRLQQLRASAFLASSFKGEGIDDPPDQQAWPLAVPRSRPKNPLGELQEFLTQKPYDADAEKFGADAKELEPSVRDTHAQANKADEYAVEAKEAAEDALRWDRGVVKAVNVADEAWDGAMYAQHVDKRLKDTWKELDKITHPPQQALCRDGHPCSKVRAQIEKIEDAADSLAEKPGRSWELKFPLKKLGRLLHETALPLAPDTGVRDKATKPLFEFLSDKDHPPLYPPADGPGIKNGSVEVPLRFPENPEPMVMEEYIPPDVQAKMPAGSLPLDLRTLKGVV